MRIIKRNGSEVTFDTQKIVNAINGANAEVDNGLSEDGVAKVADIVTRRCQNMGHTVTVEEVQDLVEDELMRHGKYDLARHYIIYRYVQSLKRQKNTTDDRILSLLEYDNEDVKQENSNKNPMVVSVQRDYMAGEVSKDLTMRTLLPEDVVKAHEEGIIHFHDADYFSQHMFNCFSGGTKFVTDKGVKEFRSFSDGDTVFVKDLHGVIREATVHTYGKQRMQKVTIKNPRMERSIICTPDHRWYLNDGTVTTSLKIGDRLYQTEDSTDYEIITYDDARIFCTGFVIGDGSDHSRNNENYVTVRLCGDKTKYRKYFEMAGYRCTRLKDTDDVVMFISGAFKQDFINGKAWRHLTAEQKALCFKGYYAADGAVDTNRLSTADERLCAFIEETSCLAGYYISSVADVTRDTNFKENSRLITYHFIKNTSANWTWKVTDIKPYAHGEVLAYCVEEPVTHTFTLDAGVVTGNCCLINLEDMLQNGTVISGTKIERPHSFSTACNIATQIIAQVASCQYGGQSISLTHLAPFVDVSRQAIRKKVEHEAELAGGMTDEVIDAITEERVKDEINKGVQTIQYQVITLMTTNGQAPFLTVFMYLNEAKNEREKADLAMIIEEVLRQRYQGVKNEKGVWITPAFPKLIYTLDEDNIHEGDPYYYLTELAAKCTARRMVPDYISAKMMRKLKLSKGETEGNGDVYTCMGCFSHTEVICYKYDGKVYTESFGRMWMRMLLAFDSNVQPGREKDLYIDLDGVEIYDHVNGWTPCRRIIRNADQTFLNVRLSSGRELEVTPDHPFETENRGIVFAKDLEENDAIKIQKTPIDVDGDKPMNPDEAWLLGLIVCDGCYAGHLTVSLAMNGEDDIAERFRTILKNRHNLDSKVVEQHRQRKGDYKDVHAVTDGDDGIIRTNNLLSGLFGGIKKLDRQLPNDFLNWNRAARVSLLAGIIDADGYIRTEHNGASIGSTNKALAIQEMLLVQSLGIPASIVHNYYKGKGRGDTVRYAVDFKVSKEIVDAMACQKKKSRYDDSGTFKSRSDKIAVVKIVEESLYRGPSFDVTTDSEHFTVSGVYSHNCRSFLTPDRSGNGWDNKSKALNYEPGKPKYYGRFNQGVVTLNLPDVALSSEKDMDRFWEIFDERLELCHRALRCRHERLLGTPSDASPIHWQYGALARLDKGEVIDPLLYGGYSTISLGYAGLYECVKYMTGYSHTDPHATGFALAVMQRMNDKCAEWKAAEDIDYSIYGTPLEATTYKFAKALQRRFGIIEGITDHGYITNSYHVNVREDIDAFTKLGFEAQFQHMSPGGAICYCECPDMQDNLEAVIKVMQFIYDTVIYAELNIKSDYCQVCGFDGQIEVVEDDGKLVWECPKCGNRDQSKMNVARRTCGYIGTQFWNQGRTEEIRDRKLHL